MAPHSSTFAWKIPWTEDPGGLQSMGSLRVGHDWATSLSLFTFMHWRKKWQPTPVFLPGESQGRQSLVGCRLWGARDLPNQGSNPGLPHCRQILYQLSHQGDKHENFGFISHIDAGEGNGNPLQYSCLENYMHRGAWWATVHWVAKSQTRLRD